jgi:hypothetical protein
MASSSTSVVGQRGIKTFPLLQHQKAIKDHRIASGDQLISERAINTTGSGTSGGPKMPDGSVS